MLKKSALFGLLLVLVSFSAAFAANEPYVISFQGKLEGAGLAGTTVPMSFSLYKSDGATPAGWDLATAVKLDENGIFNVVLGNTVSTALGDIFVNNPDGLYLQIKATTDDTELTPKRPITAAPYAFVTKNLRGGNIVFTQEANYPASPVSGMMAFNNTRKKVAYYDSTKWIEIDPVYTENTIWMRKVEAPTIGSQTSWWAANAMASDLIITDIGLRKIDLQNAQEGIKIEIYVGGALALEYWPPITGKDSSQWIAAAQYTLPIPLKVPRNKGVDYKITFEGGYSGVGTSLKGLYLHYIFLPL